MPDMTSAERLNKLYVERDSLSARIRLHEKYSVNRYGWANWVFDQYRFQEGDRVLELGCGTAGIWQNRAPRLPRDMRIVLSDYSPTMLEKAKKRLADDERFSFKLIDIQDIPYGDASFDLVIANHMLHHVPDPDKAVTEAFRVLKPGGRFYCTTMGKDSMRELQDIYHRLDGKASFSCAENLSFTLENGGDLLHRYFRDVEQHQYIDALEVTDPSDLIAYIKSYNDIPDSVSDELYGLVLAGFSGNGGFHIRKHQGIFICMK